MTKTKKRYLAWILAPALYAQTLSVSPITSEPGKPADVELVFAGSGVASPAALQWVLTYPAADLLVPGTGPVATRLAQSAGKSLACSGKWKKAPLTYSFQCILAGGKQPIPNGPIATLRFQLRPSAKAGTRAIELDRLMGVTADTKIVKVQKVDGKLSVTAGAK